MEYEDNNVRVQRVDENFTRLSYYAQNSSTK